MSDGPPPPPFPTPPPPPPPPYQQQPYPQPQYQPQFQAYPQYGAPPGFAYQPGSIVDSFIPRRSPVRRVARVLGILGIVAGVGVGAFLFIGGFVEQGRNIGDFARGPVPSPRLDLEPGDYTIFIEGDGLTNEDSNDSCLRCDEVHDRSSVEINGPDGRGEGPDGQIRVRPYFGVTSYDLGGHEGVAVGTVHIEEPGTYRVQVDSPFGEEVAIGDYDAAGIFVKAGIGMAVFFVGLFVGIPLIAFGRRGR